VTQINPALQNYLEACRERVETALTQTLPAGNRPPSALHEAMRYATLGAGKRIRPVLVYAAGKAVGVTPDRLDAAAVAVECIHVYSLIHDDLPAMDDDDLRRGKATCHKVYGEAEAILAGDALQALAFQTLADASPATPERRLDMIARLARAAGSRGMVGGQSLDLASEGEQLEIAELESLHIHKTGALIRTSVLLGALHGDADETTLHHLDHYAKCIGLAFQIQDDILDIEGDTLILGKTVGSDIDHEKATYPALLGLEGARQRATELIAEAHDSLQRLDQRADPLRWLAGYIISRKH